MGKRLFCLACAVVLVVVSLSGAQVSASAWKQQRAESAPSRLMLAPIHVSKKPSPLVSAMFLILAGMGVSMLFEKKE